MHVVVKRITKWLVRAVSVFLPEDKALQLERWRRGREDYWKFRRCDYVFASYGKSGRTWVRVMISRYFQRAYDLTDRIIMGFDNFHKLNPAVPKIFFTHDSYLRAYLGNPDSRKDFYAHRTVLLVRKPQDVVVSQFFQWKFRMRPYKKKLNHYPEHDSDISIFDFAMDRNQGLTRIIDYLNAWASELSHFDNILVVRYEDLRSEPDKHLGRLLDFLGEDVSEATLREAVEFSSVERMRKMESQNYFWRSGSRVQPKDPDNPDSFKVRKAKVGGYKDYFDEQQIATVDTMVNERLAPVFGYTDAENHTTPATSAGGAPR